MGPTPGNFWFNPARSYPLPDSTIRTLKYAAQFTINPAVGTPQTYVFAANGLYDPDVTGIGHQPYGLDQLMANYNHYEVLESCIRIRAFNSSEGSGFLLGTKLDDNGTLTVASTEAVLEQPKWSWTSCAGPNAVNAVMSTQYFKSNKFFGVRSQDRETWGDAVSNPADLAYFIVCVAPVTSLQDIGSLPLIAEIEYRARFHEPKELAQS
jgi:hypothetical protein